MKGIASMADVLVIERRQPSLPNSTYEMIRAAASPHAKAPALSFFLRVQNHTRPTTWTYELLAERRHRSAQRNYGRSVRSRRLRTWQPPN